MTWPSRRAASGEMNMNQLLQHNPAASLQSGTLLLAERLSVSAVQKRKVGDRSCDGSASTDILRLGMMQPYFFPYLGYFGLIHATDLWVVFDTPQYIRRGWVNRNRILSDGREPWKYARVPIAYCDQHTPIHSVRIHPGQQWKRDIINGLEIYRLRRAPYYRQTVQLLRELLADEVVGLADLNVKCLARCCEYIGLSFQYRLFSEMRLVLPGIDTAGEWALQTARAIGATTYINPPGGRSIFDASAFDKAGIELKFLEPELPEYDQHGQAFLPGLSIIDVLMWNDLRAVRDMIADYRLKAA